jgi:hypothetical protein
VREYGNFSGKEGVRSQQGDFDRRMAPSRSKHPTLPTVGCPQKIFFEETASMQKNFATVGDHYKYSVQLVKKNN